MNGRFGRLVFSGVMFCASLMGSRAFGSTVFLDMVQDADGPGTWSLYAEASYGDNGGIAAYNIPLLEVATVTHVSPWILAATPNFQPAGFSVLRTSDNVSTLTASQQIIPTPTPNLIYGFGQVDDSFISHGLAPAFGTEHIAYDQLDWGWPLLLAEGTYGPGQSPAVDHESINLVMAVFDDIGATTTHAPEIGVLGVPIHSPLLDAEITVVRGDHAYYSFAPPAPPIMYETDWSLSSFEGPAWNYDPYLNYDPQTAIGAGFHWDTTGSSLGTYQARISYSYTFSNFPDYYGTLTIHVVPEPASGMLLGLGAVGLIGAFRRRARG